ncbi:MAG TPA: metal ABC transporter permease [Clostridia bacterium]|nr:metal ABC transporter permease [Clostridia bacterium]
MDIFQYEFMQRALAAGIVIGIICPLAGIFLVLRRLSLLGDALSHISLTGVAAGLVCSINATLSALVFALAGSLGIEYLRRHYTQYAELAIALAMSGGMGLAVVLISLGKGNTATVLSFLFGSIVAVTPVDLYIIFAVGLLVCVSVMLLYRPLFYISFDEEGAKLAGIPINKVNVYFMLLTAVTIAVSMRIVGALLVSSLMTIPAAISLQLANSFKAAVSISVAAGLISVIAGLILSFYLSLAPGGTIILFSLLLLFLTIGCKKTARSFTLQGPSGGGQAGIRS